MPRQSNPIAIVASLVVGLGVAWFIIWNLQQVGVVYAASITVNTTDDELNTDGDCSLREAVRAANLDIGVDACTPGGGGADIILFSLSTPAHITLTQGQIGISNDPLTLTGPGPGQLTISGNDSSRLFNITSNVPVTLSGMTLQDGATTGSGGAIKSVGMLTLDDMVVQNSQANGDGGGISVEGVLTLQDTFVLSNTASGEGGGVNAGSLVLMTNGRFAHNQSGSFGGGLYASHDVTITGAEFISNSALAYAGGLWAWQRATLSDTLFMQNQAINQSVGAIYAGRPLVITASTFISNVAGQDIGGIWASKDAALFDVDFVGNVAHSGSGAVMEIHGNGWLTHTSWLSNTATDNGFVLRLLGENGRLINPLFASNQGGGIEFSHSKYAELLHATIINAKSTQPAITLSASGHLTTLNSIIADWPVGFAVADGSVYENSNLYSNVLSWGDGSLTSGGLSYVGDPAFVDKTGGDFHLTALSAALNTGQTVGVVTDRDGDPRPGGGGIDLGYDETNFTSDVSVGKTAVSTPGPAQPITYLLTIANIGDALLPQLIITDRLPIHVTGPVTISSTLPISDVHQNQPYVWQLFNLAPGDSGVITITGVLSDVLPHGLITNTVTVRSTAAEISLLNNSASAAIDVPNVAPIAVDDRVTLAEDETVTLSPTNNDIDGDDLLIDAFDPPSHGTAVLSGTAQLVYTPTLEYSGSDWITYTVSDGISTAVATITLTITAVDDSPIITAGEQVTVTLSEDNQPTPFSLTLTATDAENQPLSWSIETPASHGTAETAVGPANSSQVSFTPTANYFGSDQFTVQVDDGFSTDTIQVNLIIESVNDAPEAEDDGGVMLRQPSGDMQLLVPGGMNLIGNDRDVENSPLTVTQVGTPSYGGSVIVSTDGAVQSFVPAHNFVGSELFTYTLSDGELTDTAVATINVVNGRAGGVAGQTFTVTHLGANEQFSVLTQLPANLSNGNNIALIFDLNLMASFNSLQPSPPSHYQAAGLTFSLTAFHNGVLESPPVPFTEPVTLVVSYPDAEVADGLPGEDSLMLFRATESGWSSVGIEAVARDRVTHQMTFTVDRPGDYTLFKLGNIHLPLAGHRHVKAPDLIVESITVLNPGTAQLAGDVEVVIHNVGNAPVWDAFWVDLYIDPHTPPTAVNQTWQMQGNQGVAWGVLENALPLYPGDRLTLTLSSPYYVPAQSMVQWPLLPTVDLYAQVDSSNADTQFGGVLEQHEVLGTPTNNLLGPE